MFETKVDHRLFMACIARAVHRGEIEVVAFCIMTTHFHLLVRSLKGCLSYAMRRIMNEYVRYFNRSRGRDGPLFRSRFQSKPVLSDRYRAVLVRYIDYNPLSGSKTFKRPTDYAYGSARLYACRRRPKWLATAWIDDGVAAARERDPRATYDSVWGQGPRAAEDALVEARNARSGPVEDDLDELDELVRKGRESIRGWMVRKASLADGSRPGVVYVDARSVMDVISREQRARGPWLVDLPRRPNSDVWPLVRAGCLRTLAARTVAEIAAREHVSEALVGRRLRRHARLMEDPAYAGRMADVAAACLAAVHGSPALPRPAA